MTPPEDKATLKAASEKLLAASEGQTLEWSHDGSDVQELELYSVRMIGGPNIRIRQTVIPTTTIPPKGSKPK